MQNQTSHTKRPDHADADVLQQLLAAPPMYLCALPANLAHFRPQFMAEPEDHCDPHPDAK